jgi:hypothetical protein
MAILVACQEHVPTWAAVLIFMALLVPAYFAGRMDGRDD